MLAGLRLPPVSRSPTMIKDLAGKGPAMKYDLLLSGGDVLDPAAGLRGVMDVGIAGGKIVAVAASLPAAEARRTISAKGRLVTPGLVDIHAHIFVNAHDMAGGHDPVFLGRRGNT